MNFISALFSLVTKRNNETLTHDSPIIKYIKANYEYYHNPDTQTETKKILSSVRRDTYRQLQDFIREDIFDLTGVEANYKVNFAELFGNVTVSKRDSLRQIVELEYNRKLTAEEIDAIPIIGAHYGLKYLKKLSLDSNRFKKHITEIKEKNLDCWNPNADYAYYAWNTGGLCEGKKITLSKDIDTLEELISTLGHEAGHFFGKAQSQHEKDIIEETFCDALGEEYKEYFANQHGGRYASQIGIKKKLGETEVFPIIKEVEALLKDKDIVCAENKLKSYKNSKYNQAYLLHKKYYSCDPFASEAIGYIFSKFGAKSILLLTKATDYKMLEKIKNGVKQGASIEEILDG